MRLIELKIKNIRGLTDFSISPNKENMLIFGENGSGKSSVLDAIDFLLTGRIRRLTGEGTKNINLMDHGKNQNAIENDEDGFVEAKIFLPSIKQELTIKRNLQNNSKIEDLSSLSDDIQKIFNVAEKGHHLLTRREILDFIISKAGKRGEKFLKLLNLNQISEARKSLETAKNNLNANRINKEVEIDKKQKTIHIALGLKKYAPKDVLKVINKLRKSLKVKDIKELIPSRILEGIIITDLNIISSKTLGMVPSAKATETFLNLFKTQTLQKELNGYISSIQSINTIREKILKQGLSIEIVDKITLYRKGKRLLMDDGECPLCGILWDDPKDLKNHIEKQLKQYEEISKLFKTAENYAKKLITAFDNIKINLFPIIKYSKSVELQDITTYLESLNNILIQYTTNMEKEEWISLEDSIRLINEFKQLFKLSIISPMLDEIASKLSEEIVSKSTQQINYELLIEITTYLKGLEKLELEREAVSKQSSFGGDLNEAFIQSRDIVFESLYERIKDRFKEFYLTLHSEHEPGFDSEIAYEDESLEIKVNFHNFGNFIPHAMHSEGHLDTMGICIFLALIEDVNEGLIDLILFDDVLMSVDSNHRNAFCDLITEKFAERQFIITTHDKIWASQLLNKGIVKQENYLELYGWDPKIGPLVQDSEFWDKIDKDLLQNDINAASAKLRRGLEEIFTYLCEKLRAKVPLNTEGRWTLGELLQPGISKYRKILKTARLSAESWGNSDDVTIIKELEQQISDVFETRKAEQWVINPTVHYTKWATLTKEDFIPIVDLSKEMVNELSCEKCGGMIYVTFDNYKEDVLKCLCNNISFNLRKKS